MLILIQKRILAFWMPFLLFIAPTTISQAAEVENFPSSLIGYSIVAERIETINEQPPFDQHWHERLYFSRDGRIFSKQTLESGNPNNAGSFAMLSDQSYNGQVPFQWNGSGVSRQWTNPRNGVVLTMSISLHKAGAGYACDLDLGRQGYAGTITLKSQRCRVFRGNAVAD